MKDEDGINRFIEAQKGDYEEALAEITAGEKQSHWIWYVFPQLKGLGMSWTSEFYGIADPDEARAYLADPVLGARLREISSALLKHRQKSARAILGSLSHRSSRLRLANLPRLCRNWAQKAAS